MATKKKKATTKKTAKKATRKKAVKKVVKKKTPAKKTVKKKEVAKKTPVIEEVKPKQEIKAPIARDVKSSLELGADAILKQAEVAETGQPVKEPVSDSVKSVIAEKMIAAIIEKGKKNGYITYELMNEELPDEAISPNRLDSLLMTLDEIGVQILDEAELAKRQEQDFAESDEEIHKQEKHSTWN